MTLTTTASGFRDGLGERVFAIDRVTGEPRERLRVRPELAAFETALGLQIDRVAALTDPRFPPARDVDRDRTTGQVCVVSDYAPGERLSALLASARARGVFPDIAAGLHTANELLTAMAAFSGATKLAHGALAPSRVVISDAGDVAITDYLYAPILTRLRFSPARLWTELEIAAGAGAPGFDETSDVRQIALILMAMALGRPIYKHEYPAGAAALLSEVSEVAVISGGEAIAGQLRAWLERALNLEPRRLFGNIAHACASFGQILFDGGGVAGSRGALVAFIDEVRSAPELAEPPAPPSIQIAPAPAARVEKTPPRVVAAPVPFLEPQPIEAAPVLEEVTVVVDDRSVIAPPPTLESVEASSLLDEPDVAERTAHVEAAPDVDSPPIEAPQPAEPPRAKTGALAFFEEIVNAAKALAHRVERRAPVERESIPPEPIPAPATEAAAPAEPLPAAPGRVESAPPFEPAPFEPTRFEPAAFEPAPFEPAPLEPAAFEPVPFEPEPVTPEWIEPVRFEPPPPARIEPVWLEPAPVEAEPIEPVRFEPPPPRIERVGPDLTPFEPTPFEPEPLEPVRFEPTPFEPPRFEPAPTESPRFEPVRFEPEPFVPAASAIDLTPSHASEPAPEPAIVEFGQRSFEPAPFEVPPAPPLREPVFEPVEPVRAAPVQPVFEAPYEPDPYLPTYADPAASSSEWDVEESREPAVPEPPLGPRLVPPPAPRPVEIESNIEPEERERKKKKKKKKDKAPPPPEMVMPEIAPPGVIGLGHPPQPSGMAPSSFALPEIAPPGIVPLPPPLPPPIAPPAVASPTLTRPTFAPIAPPVPIRLKDPHGEVVLPRRERTTDSRPYGFSAGPEVAAKPYGAERTGSGRAAEGFGRIFKVAAAVVVLAVAGFAASRIGWSPSALRQGVLTVESTPSGIDVYVDDTLKGKTPLTIPVAAGAHQVKLARGKATHMVGVTVEEGKQHVERITWKARGAGGAGGAGGLRVTSQPTGAKVYVNGILQGETPLELPTLAAGRHTVTVQGSGGSVKRTVRVTAGEQAELDVELFSGFLRVLSPVELQLVENGRQLGSSGGDQVILAAGHHEILAINEPLGYREAYSVDIEPGETKTVTIQPNGTLSVNAVPWAEVWLEGTKLGETPIANRTVPIGTREVVFRHPEYGERRVVTTVKHNQLTTVTADLTRQ